MADRSGIGLLALALLGCDSDEEALRLEQVCRPEIETPAPPPCRVSGDAQETTGLTGDSLAIRFGPAGGALEIRINALGAPMEQTWSLEALAAARPLRPEGNLLVRKIDFRTCEPLSCPEQPPETQAALDEDLQWAVMVETMPGSNGNFIPNDAVLILEGADIDLVDIRTPGFVGPDENSPPVPTPR